MDRVAWHAAVHGVAKSWMQRVRHDWETELNLLTEDEIVDTILNLINIALID